MRERLAVLAILGATAAFAAEPPRDVPPAASELRTLFHTAEERAQLDRLRRGEPVEAPAAPRAPPVVGGFVKRSDGRTTAWVDGHAVTGKDAQRYADPARMRESARERNPAIDIKPSR